MIFHAAGTLVSHLKNISNNLAAKCLFVIPTKRAKRKPKRARGGINAKRCDRKQSKKDNRCALIPRHGLASLRPARDDNEGGGLNLVTGIHEIRG